MSEANMAQVEGDSERPQTMGRRLASLRALKGWTQDEAAEKAGTSQAQLSRLELDVSTRPPIAIVSRLAELYGVTIDYLWHGSTKERATTTAGA